MQHVLCVGDGQHIDAMLRSGVERIEGQTIKVTSVQTTEDALLHLRAANDEPCLVVIALPFRTCMNFMRSLRQPDGNKQQLFEGPFVFVGQSNGFIRSRMLYKFVALLHGICYDTEWTKVTPVLFERLVRTLLDPYGMLYQEAA
ncbi:hypothetical protein K2X96_00700 [Patescibacteria group bacterium]|nr:hypothetical protein [Patescibacteria group bacterium]